MVEPKRTYYSKLQQQTELEGYFNKKTLFSNITLC